MFKTGELKLLWKFYLFKFIEHLSGLGALIWTVYFVQKGFSYTEVSIALAILAAGIFILEVPTGAVADIFGRKVSVFMSFLIIAILSLLSPFVKTFWQLILLYLFWSLAATLASGADEAWVIDHLHRKRRKDLIGHYYSKLTSISQLGLFLSGLLLTGLLLFFKDSASFLAYDKIWFVQAGGMFLVSLIVLSTPEHFKREKTKFHLDLLKVFQVSKSGFSYVKNHKTLLKIFIGILIFSFSSSIWAFAYQPFLINIGLQIKDFGWARSVVGIGGMIVPFLAMYLMSKFKSTNKLLAGIFLVRFLLMATVLLIFGKVAGFIFYFLLWNHVFMVYPILNPIIQSHIPSKHRATVGSIKPMFMSVGDVSAMLIAGLLVDVFGPNITIFIAGLFIIPVIWIFYKLK